MKDNKNVDQKKSRYSAPKYEVTSPAENADYTYYYYTYTYTYK